MNLVNLYEDSMLKRLLQRVDFQVTILVAIMVAISSILVSSVVYSMSYKEMLSMLEDEVNLLATQIDENLDMTIFTDIENKDDMTRESYQIAHQYLDSIRTVYKVKYLYTAIQRENGDLIYHVDGLPYTDPDFRNVGDYIEAEFQKPLLMALQNNIVMPDDILKTEWGIVFVAYYPLHDKDGNVVAAIGIEFPAQTQYIVYRNIRIKVSIVILIISLLSGFIARSQFRRISNPNFRDKYNTDALTKLKNRNAFDMDIHNDIQRQRLHGKTLVITDLNGLKTVNDKLGHKTGDYYIEACSKALVIESMDYCIPYRIGGDEFATIIPCEYQNKASEYIDLVQKKAYKLCKNSIPEASVSMGYAVCEGSTIEAWEKALKKADEEMYLMKRAYYAKNKSFDGRK